MIIEEISMKTKHLVLGFSLISILYLLYWLFIPLSYDSMQALALSKVRMNLAENGDSNHLYNTYPDEKLKSYLGPVIISDSSNYVKYLWYKKDVCEDSSGISVKIFRLPYLNYINLESNPRQYDSNEETMHFSNTMRLLKYFKKTEHIDSLMNKLRISPFVTNETIHITCLLSESKIVKYIKFGKYRILQLLDNRFIIKFGVPFAKFTSIDLKGTKEEFKTMVVKIRIESDGLINIEPLFMEEIF